MAERIALELSTAHERGRAAFARGDAATYMGQFAPHLEYQRADGRVLTRAQLARDVRDQLRRLRIVSYCVDCSLLKAGSDGQEATEGCVQHATLEVRAFFGILRRQWKLTRRGHYEWSRTSAGWQITRVHVLEERLEATRTWLAFRDEA